MHQPVGGSGGLACQHGELINRKWHRPGVSTGSASDRGREGGRMG